MRLLTDTRGRPWTVDARGQWTAVDSGRPWTVDAEGPRSDVVTCSHLWHSLTLEVTGHWRSPEVTRGHIRSLEVTGDHSRSQEITRGHMMSAEVTHGHYYTMHI